MPRKLGPADSFNSSGATVVPDRETRDRPNNVSSLSSARVLMPQDTLGRELDAALGGDGIGNFDMVHALQSHAQMPSRQPSFSADFAVLLANPSPSTSDILASFQIDTTANTLPTSNPTPNPSSHRPIPEEQALSPEIFRPSSAHSYRSHRSSVSGSDYSYTTTEVDSDEAERMTSPGNNLPWEVGQYPTPGPSAGDPSPPTVPGSVTGPMRGPSNDEEAARKRRLEHRRWINRKSAQKHRLRRREELETLTRTIVEKDARVAQLERELAVMESQRNQLAGFIKMQLDAKNKDKDAIEIDGDIKAP